ncbi:MAG: hypothetical protein V2I40_07220 [Desulfobacteraceae bacterium]|nr:hypothetical protein [Desulfobacteraceae bacterium]
MGFPISSSGFFLVLGQRRADEGDSAGRVEPEHDVGDGFDDGVQVLLAAAHQNQCIRGSRGAGSDRYQRETAKDYNREPHGDLLMDS